jgi:tRNA (guanine-N7-)-methyltransferase
MSCADARVLLRDHVPAGSVRAVHVYFPDPWWKKRHHKRRVFTGDFVASVVRALSPGGRLHIATDVEAYFHVMRDLVTARPELRITPASGSAEPDCVTNFERKARELGTPVHRLAAEKVG